MLAEWCTGKYSRSISTKYPHEWVGQFEQMQLWVHGAMFCNLQEGNNFWEKAKVELEKSEGDCDKGKQQVTPFNKSSGSAARFFKRRREFHSFIWFYIQNAIINNILVYDADFSMMKKRIQQIKYIYRYFNSILAVPQVRTCKIWSSNLVFFKPLKDPPNRSKLHDIVGYA